jgi:hypothetical protein
VSERFTDWSTPGNVIVNRPRQCPDCRHLRDATAWACDAFPAGIPAAILTNRHDHTKPYPGDHGIRFEPIDDHPTPAAGSSATRGPG